MSGENNEQQLQMVKRPVLGVQVGWHKRWKIDGKSVTMKTGPCLTLTNTDRDDS